MTSPTSAPINRHRAARGQRRRGAGGFTLIEMLVVIGIILVLAGLLIPAVNSAAGRASRATAVSDLQVIATGLEAYKKDFGEYPRVRKAVGITTALDRPNPATGAQIL